LKNTKEAEALVVLSKEGISKGVRCIVFATQEDAKKATVAADEFKAKLKAVESLEGDELDKTRKNLKDELTKITTSMVRKNEFNNKIMAFTTKKVMARSRWGP
jgi:alanyl-tRNA synthetase